MKNNRTRVALLIYDYKDNIEEIEGILGIAPSLIKEADSDRSVARRWELSSGIEESKPVEEHLTALLKKLYGRSSALNEIAKKARCRISVGLEYIEYNPEVTLNPDMLRQLADLGIELWLDIYNLSE